MEFFGWFWGRLIRIVKDRFWDAEDCTLIYSQFYTRIMELPKKIFKSIPKILKINFPFLV